MSISSMPTRISQTTITSLIEKSPEPKEEEMESLVCRWLREAEIEYMKTHVLLYHLVEESDHVILSKFFKEFIKSEAE